MGQLVMITSFKLIIGRDNGQIFKLDMGELQLEEYRFGSFMDTVKETYDASSDLTNLEISSEKKKDD